METSLSFGIELEFSVALLKEPDEPLTAEEFQTRCQHIPPTQEDINNWEEGDTLPIPPSKQTLQEHMRKALINAGVDCHTDSKGEGDFTKWHIDGDSSIEHPVGTDADRFNWYGIEIRSPARYYYSDAMADVKKTCRVLTETYMINTNKSTGYHIHVGLGNKTYDMQHVRRLAAFFWTFENYFDSLHPEHRISNLYCKSMRYSSGWVKNNYRIETVDKGIRHFLTESFDSTSALAGSACGSRDMSYNFFNLRHGEENPAPKHTLEFRQHEASLDEDAVSQWIHTCVGIVQYCRCTSGTERFDALLKTMTLYEDVHVLQSEEKRTTIIDLLKALSLDEQADYYAKRGEIYDIVEYTTSD